jgi:hypothetical protein
MQMASPSGVAGANASPDDLMVQLDKRHRNEYRDAQWASLHETAIVNAIVGNEHDGFKVPDPEEVAVDCRSSTCHVRMVYLREEDAAQMQSKTMLGVPADLSASRTSYVANEDGTVEMEMYLGAPAALSLTQ